MSHLESAAVALDSKPPILLLIDTDAKWTGREVNSQTLYVDAPVAVLTITLRTPKSISNLPNPRLFNDWIALIQRERATRCNIIVYQCILLLDLTLTYHAFGHALLSVDTNLFKTFSESLVEMACTTNDHNSTKDVFRSLIEWIHTKLPNNIFTMPANIPPLAEPSDSVFELLASLVQLFGTLYLTAPQPAAPAQAATAAIDPPLPLHADESTAEFSDPGLDSSNDHETPTAHGVGARVSASTDSEAPAGLAPLSNHPSDPSATSMSVCAPNTEQRELAPGDSASNLTPDTLAQLLIVTTLWGPYSRHELTHAQFLTQVYDGLMAAEVPVEPLLTHLADSLLLDDAPLGYSYTSSNTQLRSGTL